MNKQDSGRISRGFLFDLPKGEYSPEGDEKILHDRIKSFVEIQYAEKGKRDKVYKKICEQYDSAANVKVVDEETIDQTHSHLVLNTSRQFKQKRDFPKYNITLNGEDASDFRVQIASHIIKSGIERQLRDMKVHKKFKGRNGVYHNESLKGDGFVLIMPDLGNIKAFSISPENILVDDSCTDLRDAADGADVTELGVVIDYKDLDTLMQDFDLTEKDIDGMNWGRYNNENSVQNDSDKVPGTVIVYINTVNKSFVITGGQNNRILKSFTGPDFLFCYKDPLDRAEINTINSDKGLSKAKREKEIAKIYKRLEAYMPIFRFGLMAPTKGFFSYGAGHLMSERCDTDTSVRNLDTVSHKTNGAPIFMINAPQGKVEEVQDHIDEALADVAEGRPGVVFVEVDQNTPNTVGRMEPMITPKSADSYNIISSIIYNDVIGLGVDPNSISSNPYKTVEGVQADASERQETMQAIAATNADEFEAMISCIIELMRDTILPTDSRKIDTSNIYLSESDSENRETIKGITMGDVSKLMRSMDIDVKMDLMSGIVPSSAIEIDRSSKLLSILAQTGESGPEMKQVLRQYLDTLGVTFQFETAQQYPITTQNDQQNQGIPQQQIQQANV